MSASALDPRVREILEDIARDPNANLLRPDPASLRTAASGLTNPERPSPVGRTVAERELLRVHDHELAATARARLREAFLRLDLGKSKLLADSRRGIRHETPLGARELADRQTELRPGGASPMLTLLLDERPLRGDALIRAAATLVRFDPSEQNQVFLCLAWNAVGRGLAARLHAERCLTRSVDPSMASFLAEQIALGCDPAADPRRVRDAYLFAASRGPLRVSPAAGVLLFSLQLGDVETAETWIGRIDDGLDPSDPNLDAIVRFQGDLRRRGVWQATEEARRALDRLEGRPRGAAGRIVDVCR